MRLNDNGFSANPSSATSAKRCNSRCPFSDPMWVHGLWGIHTELRILGAVGTETDVVETIGIEQTALRVTDGDDDWGFHWRKSCGSVARLSYKWIEDPDDKVATKCWKQSRTSGTLTSP